jgi:hypothetical protein
VTVPAKLAGFAAVLAIAFGGAAVAGNAFGPEPAPEAPAMAHQMDEGKDTTVSATGHGHDSKDAAAEHGAEAHPVRGLAVAENGLRVVVADPELRRGETERLSFRIVEEDGKTVRDFDVEHEKRMHLIIARRDLTGFQHLHPEQAADGTWSTDVRLDDAGSYRLFADFSHDDEAITLASDLRVDGNADLEDLPAPATTATSDLGYEVRLDAGAARAGQPAELRFSIYRDGRPVHTEPYLGAGGHLVALREGDLAFLHVHPTDHADGESGGHDDSIGFEATFPTEGRYRLFLQFKSEGRVHTVAFTQEVK